MILILLFLLFSHVYSYNYLVISPVYGYSHMKFMASLADTLADQGHNVTFFQPFVVARGEGNENHTVVEKFMDKKIIKNSRIDILNYYHDEKGRKSIPTDDGNLGNIWTAKKYQSMFIKSLVPIFYKMCRKVFQDKELHETLKNKNFDVVFSETFDFCGLYLADYLKAHSIVSVFSGNRMSSTQDALGQPSFLHYVPAANTENWGEKMTAYDRLNNLWQKTFNSKSFSVFIDGQFEQLSKLTNGKVRHWTKILNDVTYHFSNSNPYLDFVSPKISKIIEIGGFNMECGVVHKVSEKMNKLLEARPNTVYISFGTMVRSIDMPEEYKISMIELFKMNPNITFLWKYENSDIQSRLPDNVHISKWFPQQELLSDKRVNLFITHGGLGSTMELAYSAKIAIVIPLFADQPGNAQMLKNYGSAEKYSKFDIPNHKKLHQLLNKVLSDTSYQKNADRLAETLHYQPIKPKELVIRYAENAARFGKLPKLTPHAKNMGTIEYYNLDLIVLGISMFLFLIYGVIEMYLIVKNCLTGKSKKE